MTYAKKTLSEIKLIHGDYGNFIKGQKLPKDKEKKYKTPPYKDLAASTEIEGETLNEKCWPGYEKKGMKTMFGKRYPNCVKKKKTKKEEFSDWRSELEQIEEKKMTKAQIKKRDEIADAISTKDMKDRYGDKNVKYAIATKLAMKEDKKDVNEIAIIPALIKAAKVGAKVMVAKKVMDGKKEKEEKEETGPTVMVVKVKEELDKKDKPFVKKLVGKLRKGSKTHAKQADDLEKAMKENTAIESELLIQDWNKDDIKFTEIETIDIIKAKPLKENTNIDEGFKTRMIAKLGKKLIKKIGKVNPFTKTGAQRVTQGVGSGKKYIPPDKITSQNIQTKSVVNQAKKLVDLSKKPNKGTKAVKVDLSKPIDFDKYLGKTSDKIQKKFGSKKPTGTFTDDLPPVKNPKPKKPLKDHYDWRDSYEVNENVGKVVGMGIKKLGKELGKKTIKAVPKALDKTTKKLPALKTTKKNAIDLYRGGDTAGMKITSKVPKKFDKVKKAIDTKVGPVGELGGKSLKRTPKPTVKGGMDKIKSGVKDVKSGVSDVTKAGVRNTVSAVTSKQAKKAATVTTAVGGAYALGRMDEKDAQKKKNKKFKDVGSSEVKPSMPVKKPDFPAIKGVVKKEHYDWREELGEAWQKVNRKDKTDGLSRKAVKAYRRENPGSKLQTAVTKDPKKLKKGSKSAKRRLSFCRRMKGMKKKLTSAKTRRDPDSRINKALRRWNC